jgi:uncharacterized protein YdhG (YjbR/CyaY superfamily)
MATARMQNFSSVDAYIASQPKELQPKLEQLRQTIRKAAPEAEEGISYGMPSYKLHGPLAYFAASKNHLGFYPTPLAIEAFQTELTGYDFAKGTVRLPQDKPLPLKLIADMVKFRAKQNQEKARLKVQTKKAKA